MVEVDELVGEGASPDGEIGDAGADGFGSGCGCGATVAGLGLVEKMTDGFEDFGRVLGDDADGGAIDDEVLFADGGFDGEGLVGGHAGGLGEFEVDWAEGFGESDWGVCGTGAAGGGGTPERPPGWGERRGGL